MVEAAARFDPVNRRGARPYLRRARSTAADRDEHGVKPYILGCRCGICRNAYNRRARAYQKARRVEKEILYGRQPVYFVSAAPVVRRVSELRADGSSVRAIAVRSGVPYEPLRKLVTQPGRKTYNTHVERLLAVLR